MDGAPKLPWHPPTLARSTRAKMGHPVAVPGGSYLFAEETLEYVTERVA